MPKRKPSLASTPFGTSMLTRFIVDHHLVAMVVDDTLTIRKLMEKMLLKLGFDRVDCYENGKKGLEALLAAPVDIVFSDVQMPIMTGPEVLDFATIIMCNSYTSFDEPCVFCRWCVAFDWKKPVSYSRDYANQDS